MKYKIIDFHTHPYLDIDTNICRYKKDFTFSPAEYKKQLKDLGIEKICGSVIDTTVKVESFNDIERINDTARRLKDLLGDFYLAGYIIHPKFVKESISLINDLKKSGERLIGEIVPSYLNCAYTDEGFDEIFASASGMVFSFHSTVSGEDQHQAIDRLIEKHKDVIFVGAHPGETDFVERHIERMKKFDNYYLDISGTGIFRNGMLANAIKEVGSERILFGSDFPTCNPAMFVGGVVLDDLISKKDKQNILYKNAKKLLNL